MNYQKFLKDPILFSFILFLAHHQVNQNQLNFMLSHLYSAHQIASFLKSFILIYSEEHQYLFHLLRIHPLKLAKLKIKN